MNLQIYDWRSPAGNGVRPSFPHFWIDAAGAKGGRLLVVRATRSLRPEQFVTPRYLADPKLQVLRK